MSTAELQNGGASPLATGARCIDHIAIAVRDLEDSIAWFRDVLGFSLVERRKTEGVSSSMISAVMEAGPLQLVLLQGTDDKSQVSQFVQNFGPGVQHIAIRVDNIEAIVDRLKGAGLVFDTSIIGGGSLKQIFTKRDQGSGLMLEIIERGVSGFAEENISELFSQLESKNSF